MEIAKKYRKAFKGLADVLLLNGEPGKIVPHIFAFRVMNGKRDGLRRFLLDRNIECGIHYKPNHLVSYYFNDEHRLPVTETVYKELLSIPLHPGLSDEDVDFVIRTIHEFFQATE